MGTYLNNPAPYDAYKSETQKPYFIDKSMLLSELYPFDATAQRHICITRPRRFGKSVMANMIAAFFQRGIDASSIFDSLNISKNPKYKEHMNQHDVIYIDFSKMPRNCKSYEQYINWIEDRLIRNLVKQFPNANIDIEASAWEAFEEVYLTYDRKRFIFVMDEWDCVFHKKFFSEENKKEYIDFLAGMFKGQAYVEMAYMTGVLPIAKYSSGSTINNFGEYTMATQTRYSSYFGFTENEVDQLLKRYKYNVDSPDITREQLDYWYDGYRTADGKRVYNPRSVVRALSDNQLRSYWTATGPYSEIRDYIEYNIDGIKEDIALMLSGERINVSLEEYAVTATKPDTREEIYSTMVVYGFLGYDETMKAVYIPNKELRDEFAKTVERKKHHCKIEVL